MLWPYHLGSLHPIEQVATILLAFGPFLILGAVILVRRRQDRLDDEREQQGEQPEQPDDQRDR